MDYPVSLSLSHPDRSSRLHLLFSFLIAIPAYVVFIFTSIGANFMAFFAWFAVLFTGKYPRGMWDFVSKNTIFGAQLSAYMSHLTDTTPKWGDIGGHPLKVSVSYPERASRVALFFWPFILIPHMFLGIFYAIGLAFVSWIAMIVILFAGKYPEGMWNYSFGFLKFVTRIQFYMGLLCPVIPPTSMK